VSSRDVRSPDFVPLLSRGKHRHPRRGACFMEFASYLAGEKWSDHPACTHPLLARLARLINDYSSDAERSQLAGLVPAVVGLTSDDPRVDLRIAWRAAATALPLAVEQRQRTMALTVVIAHRLRAEVDGRAPDYRGDPTTSVLAQVPLAARWAHEQAGIMPISLRDFRRRGAPAAILYAVDSIAKASVANPDRHLRELLSSTIDDCTALIGARCVPAAAPGHLLRS
jgi:hypothetical protein